MNSRVVPWSVGLNVVLAAGLILLLAKRPAAGPSTLDSVAPGPVPASSPGLKRDEVASAPSAAPAQPAFHWSRVESTEYPVYIANLRAIGCPEQTVRDIIIADVNALFAPRYAALGASEPALVWWGWFNPRRPPRADLTRRLNELGEEKRRLLTRLLGPGVGVELPSVALDVATVREAGAFAFLPESKRSAVVEVVKRYRALREMSEPQWKGLPTDELVARERELLDARTRELAGLLSPEEMREFEIRDSPRSDELRQRYGKADLTEEEFRALYELRREFDEQKKETRVEDWKRLEADYAAALGPDRYGDVERQNDSMWRAMQTLADESGFTPDAISEAFSLKQEYRDKLVRAVGDMFADPDQDPQPLRDLAAEMDERLAGVLGPDAVKQLDRLGVLPRLVVQDDGIRKSYSLRRGAFDE